MSNGVLVPVEIPLLGDERRKNWAKVVDSVDTSKSSGWAFQGGFVSPGGIQDVETGSVIVVYGERGSRANPQVMARVYRVNSDATLTLEGEARGRAWARTLRDDVERCLGMEPGPPALSHVDDEDLAEELRARGWTVERS